MSAKPMKIRLLKLADHLPSEAAEALLELALPAAQTTECRFNYASAPLKILTGSVRASGCAASFPRDEQRGGTGSRRWTILGTSGRSFCIRRSENWSSAISTVRRGSRVRRAQARRSSRCTALCIWHGTTGNRAYCSQPFRIRFRTLCGLSSVVCFITNRVSARTSKCIRSMRSVGDSTSCNSVRQTSRRTTSSRCAGGGGQGNRRA